MKKLIFLLLTFTMLSCSTEEPVNRITPEYGVTFNENYIGNWIGRDYHKNLYITEHSLVMEIEGDTLQVTQAIQMAQTDTYNGLGLGNDTYLGFDREALDIMWVTYTAQGGELLFRDLYQRQEN